MKILQFFVDEFSLVFLWWTRQAPHRPMCRSTCVKAALQTPSMRATAKVTFSAPNSFISLIRVRKLRPEIVERRNHSRWPRFRSAHRTYAPWNKRLVISPPNRDTHPTHTTHANRLAIISAIKRDEFHQNAIGSLAARGPKRRWPRICGHRILGAFQRRISRPDVVVFIPEFH